MTEPPEQPDLSSVPLFPLPNVVLFPRAVLPLHIFEERYKEMTADALAGQRLVAMALLKPGWEKGYYHRPAIEPVVCVGSILSHERLPDGKYNFLLQGHTRARIAREFGDKSYRLAQLEPLRETNGLEIDLSDERDRLSALFRPAGPGIGLGATPLGRQFRQLLAGAVPTAGVADLLAFNYVDDVALKQSLLEDADVRRRVRRIVAAVEQTQPPLQATYLRNAADPQWN